MNSQKEYLEEHSHLNQGSEMQMEKRMQDTIPQSDINSSVDEALNDNQPKYDDTNILDMMNTSEKTENIQIKIVETGEIQYLDYQSNVKNEGNAHQGLDASSGLSEFERSKDRTEIGTCFLSLIKIPICYFVILIC